jgi:hypothetical protein
MLALSLATSAHISSGLPPLPLAISTATRWSKIRACDDAVPEEEQPVMAYALASVPAIASLICAQPAFVAVLLPLLVLGRTVQATPAAAVLVAILLYDAGATLLGDGSGALIVLTLCSVTFAALILGITDESRQVLEGATSREPPPAESTAEGVGLAKELSPEEADLLEAKRQALRLRKSWDSRLQWRVRKRLQTGAKKASSDADNDSDSIEQSTNT